ncbi:MAG: hypothetical protein N2484_00025 [Clostridia bacterium]|nr:hypothetical protein [Clostridia bacterium]
MKKIALTLFILMVSLMSSVFTFAVWADDGTSVVSNGDRVSIFGDIIVDKSTVGSIVSIFGDVDVQSSVTGDIVAIFGSVRVNQPVDGDIVAILGDMTLNANASRDVVAILGKVKLTGNAVINGDLVAIGSIDKDAGAKVFGQEVKVNLAFLLVARAITIIVLAFLVLILGLVIIAIFKERAVNISHRVEERTGRKIAVGLLGLLGFFILMMLLSIVVVGPILYLLLMIIAEVAVSIYFGKQILKVFNANLNVYLEFVTGLAVLSLLKIILTMLIPQIGFITYLFVYIALDLLIRGWGIGILIDTKFGTIFTEKTLNHSYNKNSDIAFDYDIKGAFDDEEK